MVCIGGVMIIAATGHRPDKLGGYGIIVARKLRYLARQFLEERRPERVISGMAQGWDTAWALAADDLKIPFIAAVPCPGQERPWPPESQRLYRELLSKAAEVIIISEHYSARNMQRRNKWMVDHVDEVAALWDGSLGGTANCVAYASKINKPLVNLWPRWMAL